MNRKGTTFPVVSMKEVPSTPHNAQDEPYRPVVLVVDDESMIADSLADILKRSGYTAVPAYDGEAALETALLMPPELLISDVVLPGMNGIELAITVKRIFPDCKVILSSGQSSTSRLLASADSAGHHFVFLNKPVHPKELLERVAESLKSRKQPVSARPAASAMQSSAHD
jgi:DNA-binding response OmpR family regulator